MKYIKNYLVSLFGFSLIQTLKKFNVPQDGCLHVGANIGSEFEMYEEYGMKNVIWIEGYKPFYEELIKKVHGNSNHYPFNIMVSDIAGETVSFKVASNTGSSTIFEPTESWYETFSELSFEKTETVTCSRIDDTLYAKFDESFLRSMKLVVLDIEGAELKALKSMGKLLKNAEFAFVELSLRRNFHNAPIMKDIDSFLYENSFKRVFLKYGSASGDALYKKVDRITTLDRVIVIMQDSIIQLLSSMRITDFVVNIKTFVKKIIFK
jgi:FkbM family methyltransferase